MRWLVFLMVAVMHATPSSPIAETLAETKIIAHRGASAYLPEHTMEAYLMAYGQGADFLEPDLVLTRDGVLIALHDRTLDATSDVARVFPNRAREDGLHYAIDFSLAELQRLNFNERIDPATGKARFPDRWPVGQGEFGVVTFDALIQTTRALNERTGRAVGLYPELKFPRFHAEHGQDIGAALVSVLDRHELPADDLPVWIQCFIPETLRALRVSHGGRFTLVQLIGENSWGEFDIDFEALWTPDGLDAIATYADGIGPPFGRLVTRTEQGIEPSTHLVEARRRGLALHPFTFRRESMPLDVSLEALLQVFIDQLEVDALFTDHPDVAVQVRQDIEQRSARESAYFPSM